MTERARPLASPGFGLLGLILALVSVFVPRHAEAADTPTLRRMAVIVGANEPPEDRAALRYAHDDAREVADVLESVGGFAPSDVRLLLDPDPSQLLSTLDEVGRAAGDAGGNVLFVFYYSGHSDGQALFPHGAPLPVTVVREKVERLGARIRVGILDTCRGGSWTQSKGLTVGPPLAMADLLNVDTEGTALVSSSSGIENAHEAASVKGSFFTHYLAAGLRGAADRKGDGNITLQEAFDYAREHTVRDSALQARTPQHPSFDIALRGRQDIVLTTISTSASALEVTVHRAPFEVIQLASGATVVDSPPTAGPLRIALPPGRYLVRVVDGGRVYAREVSVVPGTTVRVGDAELEAAGDTRLAMKGGGPPRAPSSPPAPLSIWSPPRGTHWLLSVDVGVGGDASPPSNVSQGASGAQTTASFTAGATLWYRITDRLSWSVPWPAFAYRFGTPGRVEVMPYVGLAATSWNSSSGVSLGFTVKTEARIWTAESQRLKLGIGLVMPAYETSSSPLDHLAIGGDLDPFAMVGYDWTIRDVVTLGADVVLNNDYQVPGNAGPGGYEAEWLRLGAEVDVRVAPKVGLTLRGAWSDELHGGSESYPGFLLGTRVAF
jgi:hypothetical protein